MFLNWSFLSNLDHFQLGFNTRRGIESRKKIVTKIRWKHKLRSGPSLGNSVVERKKKMFKKSLLRVELGFVWKLQKPYDVYQLSFVLKAIRKFTLEKKANQKMYESYWQQLKEVHSEADKVITNIVLKVTKSCELLRDEGGVEWRGHVYSVW